MSNPSWTHPMDLKTALKMERARQERRPVFQMPRFRNPSTRKMAWLCLCGTDTITNLYASAAECRSCRMLMAEPSHHGDCGRLASWTLDHDLRPVHRTKPPRRLRAPGKLDT